MFCFQCQQTAGNIACEGKSGVCGKKSDNANLQDELTGALIGLGRALEGEAESTQETAKIVIEGLFTTITNVNFNNETLKEMIEVVHNEKARILPGCSSCAASCGKSDDFNMDDIWNGDEDIRSLKSLILFGIRGMSAYVHHAMVLGYQEDEINKFLYKALFFLGYDCGIDVLLSIALEVGEVNLKCMELLDKANTESYGIPIPTNVTLTIEKGPLQLCHIQKWSI